MFVKKRLKKAALLAALVTFSSLTAFACLTLLGENVSLYYLPHQLSQDVLKSGKSVALGGVIAAGSLVKEISEAGVTVKFSVNDPSDQNLAPISVVHRGVLPALLVEGQGVVLKGSFDEDVKFHSTQMFMKHGEDYRPRNTTK